MAEKIFQGFELLTEAQFNALSNKNKQKIYFVRTSTGTTKEDGFIYFNGKKYGTGKLSSDKIQNQLTALENTLNDHIANKANVTVTDGNITADDSTKWLSGDAIAQIKTYVDSEDVKSMVLTEDHKIQLKNNGNAVLAELDATSFIKDGMLESVTLVDDKTKGKVLQFTWNTDGGKKSTPIEVSEFFHEISGDTNTITVTQPASGAGSLQISAKTVASVSGVTSGATALMTGGITQQYVAQEINNLKTGLDSTLALSAITNSVTYATANIVQTDGTLNTTDSRLVLNVATGLTKDHAGFVYNSTGNTFTTTESAFNKQGLLDATEVIALLRNNNTNIANALTYLKGQIPTVVSGNYINVTKSGTQYRVSADDALETAINNANSAVQSVNGQSGQNVDITGAIIALGDTLSNFPDATASWTVNKTLDDIYDKLSQTSSNALTSVSGSNSINVTAKESGSQTISVKRKTITPEEKGKGYIQIEETSDGIYGLLYFGGDDVEA